MRKPTLKLQKRADAMIAVLEAWKQGKPLQRKTRAQDWHDWDEMDRYIDERAVQYRVKK